MLCSPSNSWDGTSANISPVTLGTKPPPFFHPHADGPYGRSVRTVPPHQSCFCQPPTIGRLIEATRGRAELRPQFWGRKTTPKNETAGAAPNVAVRACSACGRTRSRAFLLRVARPAPPPISVVGGSGPRLSAVPCTAVAMPSVVGPHLGPRAPLGHGKRSACRFLE